MYIFIKKISKTIIKLNNWLLIGIGCISFLLFSATVLYMIEPDTFKTPFNALWYVMTTVTTVGYGDFYPTTIVGKSFVMVSLYLFGIGVIGLVIGGIIDSFGNAKRRREGGNIMCKKENHIIIIGWSQKAKFAMEEFLELDNATEVLIIDTLEKAPFLSDRVSYLKGDVTDKRTYENANLKNARAVLVFSDDTLQDSTLTDGKTLLIASIIEDFCPRVHTTVEVKNQNHKEMFKNKVDSVVLSNETISSLVVKSTVMSGIVGVHEQLFSYKKGQDLFFISKRKEWVTYADAFLCLLDEGATLISNSEDLEINKKLKEPIPEDASLYIVCDKETYERIK